MQDGRKTGSGTSNETFEKILKSPDQEEEKFKPRTKEDIEKILQKVLQSLDEKSEVKDQKEKKIEDSEDEIFENVTMEERNRFYKLLNELKLRNLRLKSEDFKKIERILPQYFKEEYEYGMQDGIRIQKESFSKQIDQELRALQRELPLLSLEMQIILTFMDKKRWAIQDLLSIMKSNEKDKLLEQKNFRGVISDDEYQELKKDLSRDTIARVLSNHRFKSMNSEIKYSL